MWTLLPECLLTLLAMTLGWGVSDWRGLIANPARACLLAGIVVSLLAAMSLRIQPNPFQRGKREGAGWPIVLGMFSMPAVWFAIAYCDRRGIVVFTQLAWIRWLGLAAYAVGQTMRLLALHQLGTQYSSYITVQEEHQLVESGVYRRIRHPYYLGNLLVVPGTMLVFRSIFGIFVFGLAAGFVLSRVRREERYLSQHLEGYEQYQRRSWKLIPYIY